jgi:hypothetical protein
MYENKKIPQNEHFANSTFPRLGFHGRPQRSFSPNYRWALLVGRLRQDFGDQRSLVETGYSRKQIPLQLRMLELLERAFPVLSGRRSWQDLKI